MSSIPNVRPVIVQFNSWINTKDKLPPPGKRVLVCALRTIKEVMIGFYAPKHFLLAESYIDFDEDDTHVFDWDAEFDEYYLKEGWFVEDTIDGIGLDYVKKENVTHWQLLPELPADDSELCGRHADCIIMDDPK